MEELSDFSSAVMEFLPQQHINATTGTSEACTTTDLPEQPCDQTTQPNEQSNASSQTDTTLKMATLSAAEEEKLACWLRRLLPHVEAELQKPTPNNVEEEEPIGVLAEQLCIETYQNIPVPGHYGAGANVPLQGLAIWLAVQTYDAPALVVTGTTTGNDDDEWNGSGDGVINASSNQCLKVYLPQRLFVNSGNFVAFAEVAALPVKIIRTLTTNPWSKNMFAGSTLDGDVYVWHFDPATNSTTGDGNGQITELHQVASPYGWAVCLEWASNRSLIAGHPNGSIIQWTLTEGQKSLRIDWQYQLKCPSVTDSNEITTLVCLDANEMVVGTNDGGLYQLWNASLAAAGGAQKQLEVVPLRQHRFMVSTLLLARFSASTIVISCDLSGQLFYHNLRHYADEDSQGSETTTAELPLPFKNAVGCSRDADIIYSPGIDGSLECYRIRDGQQATIRGALRGQGNFIKCSDNGRWIITGIYNSEFQIFHMGDKE